MSVGYKKPRADGRSAHSYYCKGDYDYAGPQCGHVTGRVLDAAVVKAALSRLALPSRNVTQEAWEDARKKDLQGKHHRQTLLNRARQRAVDLEARFLSVSPAHRLVAEDLEKKLEAAKREVKRLETSTTTEKEEPSLFTKDSFAELVAICSDLLSIFNAATTSSEDRKELLRTVVKSVIVDQRTPEVIRVRIVWADGAADARIDARLSRYAYPFIKEWAANGASSREIAQRLNEMNLATRTLRPWSREAVDSVLREFRKRERHATATTRTQPLVSD
jgi:hypothetical protein